ncbi:MAG: hydrogenase maturation protease [Candidatus Omnitrophota bacterium]
MNKFAVIGLGNTLRRDDGVGIIVLESLLKHHKQSNLDYLNYGVTSFDLINRVGQYDLVFLLDGINAGLTAGSLKIFELKDIKYNSNNTSASTHELDLTTLFELYKKFELSTKIYVLGIQVSDISFEEGLSDKLKTQLEQNIKEINSFICDKIKCVTQSQEK